MLTLYRPRKSGDSEESDGEKIIPPGAPYLTKVHGKLAMARQKTPKAADIAIDLLGEVFGSRSTILRKRSKSLEKTTKTSLLICGSPYVPQPQLTYSAPIPQQAFPQPGPTVPMLQYQYPQPNLQTYSPNMIPLPQFPTQYRPQYPQPEPQRYTVPPSKPTEKDFEQLKRIDAHYNKSNAKETKRLSAGSAVETIVEEVSTIKANNCLQEESATKTTATITNHACANCRRLRSRKYHHEHPIKVGETPDPAFCRKCQKDASSTSGSDDDKSPKRKKKNASKNKGTSENVRLGSAKPSVAVELERQKKKEKTPPPEQYIIVEEEHPQDARRCYTRLRIESDVGRLPLSPQAASENKRPESPLPKKHQEPTRRGRRPMFSSYEESLYNRKPATQASHNDGISVPERLMGDRENSFDTVSSTRSSEARRRRRVERANPDVAPAAPWDAPHVIHPRPGDETIVVTERFVYRAKKQMEEHRRQQEYIDKSYYHSQDEAALAEEEASRYYHENWSRDEPVHVREEPFRRTPGPVRYCQDEIADPEVADSESSDYFRAERAVFHDIPPRAPTPEPVSSLPEAWPEIPPYHLSSNEETEKRVKATKGKALRREPPDRSLRRRGRSTSTSSNYRPPLVQESSEGGTKNALSPSPPRSPRRVPSYDDDYSYVPGRGHAERHTTDHALAISPKKYRQRTSYDDGYSDMTERERMAERETKRVTFRSPSSSSVSSAWSGYKSDVTESFLRRKTSWDDSELWKKK